MKEVTRILSAIEAGDSAAAEQLLPLVYSELRRLAAQKLAHEPPSPTFEPTSLVHEAYLRLVGGDQQRDYKDRRYFFAAAAEAMRRILIEAARRRKREKHGGGQQRQPLDADIAAPARSQRLLALDEALQRLERQNPQAAELVKLRYFAGLTAAQAAQVLDVSPRKAAQIWAYAKAWLREELGDREPDPPSN